MSCKKGFDLPQKLVVHDYAHAHDHDSDPRPGQRRSTSPRVRIVDVGVGMSVRVSMGVIVSLIVSRRCRGGREIEYQKPASALSRLTPF